MRHQVQQGLQSWGDLVAGAGGVQVDVRCPVQDPVVGKLVEVLVNTVELGPQLEGVEATDEDHIGVIGVVVVGPLVVGVQRIHRLVVADPLGEVVVVGHLHFDVVAVVMKRTPLASLAGLTSCWV